MHKLLARQLRQCFGSLDDVPAALDTFIAAVEQAYLQSDDDREQLERSMDTVSLELSDRFRRMRDALADSERAKAEQSQALSVLSATLESTTDGMLVVDRHGRMTQMNRRFVELWQLPSHIEASRDDAEALAWVADQLVDPAQFLARVHELYAQPLAESFDVLHFTDGRIYERYSLPQRIGPETVGRVWTYRDITARQRLEEELRQSQKMEAIGALAGGVAHDFNNLLTVISGHAELLRSSIVMSPDDAFGMAEISAAAERATMLTRQLLTFSRKQMLQPAVLDLNAVIGSLTPMLGRLIGEHIVISVNSRAGLGAIVADPGQIQQVLMNLVVNARDAMPNGGRIEVAAENVTVGARTAPPGDGDVPPGQYVRLSVSDTGTGIPPAVRDRIFEPFFTTKPQGEGTGLGLSTVFGIVRQSGGHIAVASEAGAGTVFTIHFPRAEHGSATIPAAAQPAGDTIAGGETILLTEDQAGVRALTQRMLKVLGYTVLAASNAEQAMEVIRNHQGRVDLLLTDVVMPGLSGPQLADEIRRCRPEVRALYMSGYTNREIERSGSLGEDAVLLEKPFTRERLGLAVRAALASRP